VGYPQMNIVIHKQKGERTIIEAVYKHYPQGWVHNLWICG